MQTARIDRTKVWTAADYLQLGEMTTPCELINGQANSNVPHLHLAGEGTVTSIVLPELRFDLKEIF